MQMWAHLFIIEPDFFAYINTHSFLLMNLNYPDEVLVRCGNLWPSPLKITKDCSTGNNLAIFVDDK